MPRPVFGGLDLVRDDPLRTGEGGHSGRLSDPAVL
jgi:hypothetical protein